MGNGNFTTAKSNDMQVVAFEPGYLFKKCMSLLLKSGSKDNDMYVVASYINIRV